MTDPQRQKANEPESTARDGAGDPEVRTEPIEDLDVESMATDDIVGGCIRTQPCGTSANGGTT